MKLIIIRHAEPDYESDSITPKGKREAALLAERITAIKNIAGVYVPPMGRALATAAPCADRLQIQPEILPWLQEFRGRIVDPQTGENRIPWDLKHELWENQSMLLDETHWADHPLMASSSPTVREIYNETCRELNKFLAAHGYFHQGNRMYRCEENSDKTLVLFCHMALAMAMVGYLTQTSPFALWHGFCMPPSSVTTVVTEERIKGLVSFRCFQVGDTSHLAIGKEPPSRMAMFQEIYKGTDHTNAT
ncbi:MAG: histidine phosphatase family protein [Clostridia bacterium]|nr:histidine phosphatase family protein [Clostridia bacterium]